MADLIDRQAAIDALDVLCQEHRYKIPGKRETYSQYNEAWQDALDRAEGAIGNLPSAQPELNYDEWCIDCKEYNKEKHCCPRWNKVIRETLKDAQRWIPRSERLPEANGRYLVTRGLNACGAMWNRVYLINYSDLMGLKSERIWWDGNVGKSDFERIDDVIAWMPLPEPYREEGEQE